MRHEAAGISGSGGAVACVAMAKAQQIERARRIGVSTNFSPPTIRKDNPDRAAFFKGYKSTGGQSDATCGSISAGALAMRNFKGVMRGS